MLRATLALLALLVVITICDAGSVGASCTKDSDCHLVTGIYCSFTNGTSCSGSCSCVAYAVGSRVSGNYQKLGNWYPGRISKISSGLYDIVYDDGFTESSVNATYLVPLREEPREEFQLREKVEVKISGKWTRGIVRILQANGQYTIELDTSGIVVPNVAISLIRPLVVYVKGQKVEASQCYWWKATIQETIPDGRYTVIFGDGFKANLVYSQIRKDQVYLKAGDACLVQITVGGAWLSGYVVTVDADTNEYGVAVDGGGVYFNIPSSRIKPKGTGTRR